MVLVVTGVGALIHVFSVGDMHEDAGYARYFAYLNLFVFFMLMLVLGASFPVMFVGWEGVGLCSYLLIGFWFTEQINADAGKKAFIVNRIGDSGFLIAMFLIFRATGALDFGPVFGRAQAVFPAAGTTITAVTLLLFLGCAGKSAQIPLYTWLPDAMQGPTPVSALIHAATMVTAGVYLVARCNVLFALSPLGSAAVAGVGALTALFAATIALLAESPQFPRPVGPHHGRADLVRILGDGRRGGAAHGVLHDAAHALHLPRSHPHGRAGAAAPARGAMGDDRTAARVGAAEPQRGPAQPPRAHGRRRVPAPLARAGHRARRPHASRGGVVARGRVGPPERSCRGGRARHLRRSAAAQAGGAAAGAARPP